MRYNEILNEFLIKMGSITIHRNPVKLQVLNLFTDAIGQIKHKQIRHEVSLRGIIVGNKIYLWNSMDGTHFDMVQKMVREGIIDHPEDYLYVPHHRTSVIPSYSGFYLYLVSGDIEFDGYYNNGANLEANRELFDKFLIRWNS